MADNATSIAIRRPRFRRTEPPAFRITDDDLTIIRTIAEHRFLRSSHVAALVGRSIDRTNDRLQRLFHAGYVDRPRAQLDYYPSSGSAPMVYALADLGALLLRERLGFSVTNREWSRRNGSAGRPFIEHQMEVAGFQVALERAARRRGDIRLLNRRALVAAFPEATRRVHNPLSLRAQLPSEDKSVEVGIVPDTAFGIAYPDGSRRCFLVEIDRGTMPVSRADLTQSSFERKMFGYLTAYDARQHEQRFGWKAFRVLVVTTDHQRLRTMLQIVGQVGMAQNSGPALFLFASRDEISRNDPLAHAWLDGTGRRVRLA